MTDVPVANDADAGVVRVTALANVDADRAWTRIGGFADAGMFLNVTSALRTGDGDLGSERIIGDEVVERMVAQGIRFYAYVQSEGPMAAFGYHGCVAVEADGPERSIVVYTLVYDAQAMPADSRASEHARLASRFTGAARAMADHAAGLLR